MLFLALIATPTLAFADDYQKTTLSKEELGKVVSSQKLTLYSNVQTGGPIKLNLGSLGSGESLLYKGWCGLFDNRATGQSVTYLSVSSGDHDPQVGGRFFQNGSQLYSGNTGRVEGLASEARGTYPSVCYGSGTANWRTESDHTIWTNILFTGWRIEATGNTSTTATF